MSKNRFVFEFEGRAPLTPSEFFSDGVPEEISVECISEYLDGISVDDLLNYWNMAGDIDVCLHDVLTGAIWQNTGSSWVLIKDRDLLPGEQRLF